MALLDFQLRALGYPHTVDITKPETVRKLVIWLENLKIREYKIEERKPLANTQSPAWDAAFKKYLSDLDCPLPLPPGLGAGRAGPGGSGPGELLPALQWLLAYALHLEYEDNADKEATAAATAAAPPAAPPAPPAPSAAHAATEGGAQAGGAQAKGGGGGGGGKEVVFSDLSDPAVVSALQRLLGLLGSAAGGGGGAAAGGGGPGDADIVRQLQAAAQLLVCGVGPALRARARGAEGAAGSAGQSPRQALARVPLGFELPGGALSSAAAVLRLLYVRDLRRLQSHIDHALVEMQEYTANPRTDASLGKVGR